MTSKEIVTAALAGQATARIPAGPLAVHFCASFGGYNLRQYATDAKALAASVLRYYERFQPDAVWVSADTWVSAEAMGAKVGSAGEDQPLGGIGLPVIRRAADIDKIPAPDVSRNGRYALMLEAVARVAEAVGKQVFVVGCFDQYPFSLATELMGIQEAMVKVVEDPSFVQALMDRCAEYALAYGTAMSSAGADMLSGGDSPAGLLGPSLYERIALPGESGLVKALKIRTGKPLSLHICGDTTPLLPLMASSGADVLELDYPVDLARAAQSSGPGVALWGNLDPVATLLQGSPELVRQKARAAVAAVKSVGHSRFVLSSGCTLAVGTPDQNVDALILAASVEA
jgi:uroporphyrinogen decarboxylase